MTPRNAISVGKAVLLLNLLALSVSLLTGTNAYGQTAAAQARSTAPPKKTIQAAQEHLLALGYLSGSVDGVMGPNAITALKEFQADHNLPVTGRLDRKTLDALSAEGDANYRDLTKDDGLECHMYTSMLMNLTTPSSAALRSGGSTFECVDASMKSREIGLVATHNLGQPAAFAPGAENKYKVAIVTKDFGTIYVRHDEKCVPYDDPNDLETAKKAAKKAAGGWRSYVGEEGKTYLCTGQDLYEMTDVQIKRLKVYLGL